MGKQAVRVSMAAGASHSGTKHGGAEVDELLRKMTLSEAEQDGVILAEEDKAELPEVKWMAVAKVLTTKQFSDVSLISSMQAAWNTAREVTFRPISKNLMMVQAHCLGDWKRIMEDGPWLFRGYAVMLEEYDGSIPSPPEPSKVQVWVQIHKIPPLYRTEKIISQLAGRVGEVIKVEMEAISTSEGDFHRARVAVHATKPLTRCVKLAPEGRESMMLWVKYEKVPRFCAHCGLMGHSHLECGTGEYGEEELQYGTWMVAGEESWRRGTPRFRNMTDGARGRGMPSKRGGHGMNSNRGGRASRGGGVQGVWREKEQQHAGSSRKRMSEEAAMSDDREQQADSASSPLKKTEKETRPHNAISTVKKSLDVVTSSEVPPPPPSYVSPREQKRLKRMDNKNVQNLAIEAAPSVGRQEQ